jgi:hypothetical protein
MKLHWHDTEQQEIKKEPDTDNHDTVDPNLEEMSGE